MFVGSGYHDSRRRGSPGRYRRRRHLRSVRLGRGVRVRRGQPPNPIRTTIWHWVFRPEESDDSQGGFVPGRRRCGYGSQVPWAGQLPCCLFCDSAQAITLPARGPLPSRWKVRLSMVRSYSALSAGGVATDGHALQRRVALPAVGAQRRGTRRSRRRRSRRGIRRSRCRSRPSCGFPRVRSGSVAGAGDVAEAL